MAEKTQTRKGGPAALEVPYPSKVSLPVRRPAIVHRQRLIEYSRGKIRILDHAGLEAAACSCYAAERASAFGSSRSYSVLTTA